MITKLCETCVQPFQVIRSRASTAKYCSTGCRDVGLKAAPNQTCKHCGGKFHMKQSQVERYARTLGTFCSYACAGHAKKTAYLNDKNPNHKGRNIDTDGYRIYSPKASSLLGHKKIKLHTAICLEILGITKLPAGTHVHHRDCDIQNNTPENLVVLSASDHKWIHKQYGVATLWAYAHKRISLEELITWSDAPIKANEILPLTVEQQRDRHFFKEA
jgi:hypothetical protein